MNASLFDIRINAKQKAQCEMLELERKPDYIDGMRKLLIAALIAVTLAGCFDSFGGRGHGWAPMHCHHGYCGR